ncbi:hypothetical protein WA026_005700 [Henosepilachna vigintioctopunctata]|uniref:F-box domain-containing protein n=1 Tax=Henosepilachna vigintioctopunctata TaxID=420089 RepID=A0AAW1U1Q2_9CUCU
MPKRRKFQINTEGVVPMKKLRSRCCFDDIPQEILVVIFSFIPKVELSRNLSLVCKKWKTVTSTPSLWKSIQAGRNIPTNVLSKWVKESPLLQEIHLVNRNDTDEIVGTIGKYSKNLQHIKLEDCWGSQKSIYIKSKNLCNLVQRCRKLSTFHFSGVKLLSCKFFQLLSTRGSCEQKRRSCSYYGPVNSKQMKSLLQSLSDSELYGSASVAAAEKKIFVELDNQSLQNFDDLWRNIVSDGGVIDEVDIVNVQ